jgi:hypothetical protein
MTSFSFNQLYPPRKISMADLVLARRQMMLPERITFREMTEGAPE